MESDEFSLELDIIYLNHAAVSPWPRRTVEAVRAFADENFHKGSSRYPRWLETELRLRRQLATLINAPSADDIALLKNTSEALSFVAYGLTWKSGENIVISDQEFPSNRIVWESLSQRFGVEVRRVNLNSAPTPEDALLEACDSNTRLLAISSIQYSTGLRLDLIRLGENCRRRGILFCVDAIQSVGAVRTDVQAIQADFLMADGHKWMLGPEGLALFYCRPEWRERLLLNEYGWHMVEDASDFDRLDWTPAKTAMRFECGSPNMLGVHALEASVSLLLEIGMETIETQVLKRTAYLLEAFQRLPNTAPLTDDRPGRFGGIVTFRHHQLNAPELHSLLVTAGVQCAARGGGIRLSPHFHTPLGQLSRVVEFIEAL